MAYTYVLQDITSGTLLDEIPLRSVNYSHVLNAPGAFNGSIDRRHPKATRTLLEPNSRALYVLRGEQVVWGGILLTVRSNGDGLNIGAEGFWSYFRRRRLRHTKNYHSQLGGTAGDPLFIVRDLINYAQDPAYSPGGNIGVVVGSETYGSTVDRIWYGYERRKIGDIVEALHDNTLRFDFSIDVTYDVSTNVFTKTLVLSKPTRGRRTNLTWEIGHHGTLSEYLIDGTKQANMVHGIGAGDGDAMLLRTASDPSQLENFPLLEDAFIAKDISEPDHLQQLAQARLDRKVLPVTTPAIYLRDTPETRIGQFIVGDEVKLTGGDGFTTFNSFQRIDSYSVDVSDEGNERTRVEFVSAGSFDDAEGAA